MNKQLLIYNKNTQGLEPITVWVDQPPKKYKQIIQISNTNKEYKRNIHTTNTNSRSAPQINITNNKHN